MTIRGPVPRRSTAYRAWGSHRVVDLMVMDFRHDHEDRIAEALQRFDEEVQIYRYYRVRVSQQVTGWITVCGYSPQDAIDEALDAVASGDLRPTGREWDVAQYDGAVEPVSEDWER